MNGNRGWYGAFEKTIQHKPGKCAEAKNCNKIFVYEPEMVWGYYQRSDKTECVSILIKKAVR